MLTEIERNWVKAKRKELGLTQEQLAAEIGVIRDSISRIETGKDVTFSTARKILQYLGVNIPIPARNEIGEVNWNAPVLPRYESLRSILANRNQVNRDIEDLDSELDILDEKLEAMPEEFRNSELGQMWQKLIDEGNQLIIDLQIELLGINLGADEQA